MIKDRASMTPYEERNSMELQFKKLDADSLKILKPLFVFRKNKTCDSVFLGLFLWKDYYNVRYAISEDNAVFLRLTVDGKEYAALPICEAGKLSCCFSQLKTYFNQTLSMKLNIFLADEEAVTLLSLPDGEFFAEEVEDARDYLYSAEALRSLTGRKLHKKKNLLNAFLRTFDGRFEYRRLSCTDGTAIKQFLARWGVSREDRMEGQLEHEILGIHEILHSCALLDITMAGVYVDSTLEAFTIGSYNPLERMAVIHIEKANPEIKGLYQFINQQFLIHEFPDAILVNREDDLGDPGLRQAKLSYCPLDFARKYRIRQR